MRWEKQFSLGTLTLAILYLRRKDMDVRECGGWVFSWQSGRVTVPDVRFDLLLSWSALPALLSLSSCRLTPHLRRKMKKQQSFWMPVFIPVGSSRSCNHLPNPDCWTDTQSLIFLCLTLHKTHNFSSAAGAVGNSLTFGLYSPNLFIYNCSTDSAYF